MILRAVKIALIALLLLIFAAAGLFTYRFRHVPAQPEETLIFTVEKGATISSVARSLTGRGVMEKEWPFTLGYKFFHSSETLKAGDFKLDLPLSPRDILDTLLEGREILYPVTIIEGLTRREIAGHLSKTLLIAAEDFLAATDGGNMIKDLDPQAENLEGYLFPETYHFPNQTSAGTVVRELLAQFRSVFSQEWRRRASDLGMSIRQVVTLASLIEKETAVSEEKPIISGVFHNRLRIGMKLDCDPTIIYALKEEGRFDGNLRKRDMSWDSPYNTYVRAGLPPGPIANPGRESIRAALYPEDVSYLYFVSKNDGSHQFSSTFREHQNAVSFYQKKRR
jgi:UPF0755 protein